MSLADTTLDRLEQSYAGVLRLTPNVHALLANAETAGPFRERYAASRFVRVDDVVPAAAFSDLAATLAAIVRPVADVVVFRHAPEGQGVLSFGGCFHRVDAACARSPQSQSKLELLLERLGVTEFGSELGAKLTPLIRAIVGEVVYGRVYIYFYDEGDYISPHDDSHVGERIDVQFPITFGGIGGIRVLSDGLFRMCYDRPGAMNILGPSMWHDVPPLVALPGATAPRRINLGLRFTRE